MCNWGYGVSINGGTTMAGWFTIENPIYNQRVTTYIPTDRRVPFALSFASRSIIAVFQTIYISARCIRHFEK